jgi:RsiW-degrading membrane proteinase PrsW (M82 family)
MKGGSKMKRMIIVLMISFFVLSFNLLVFAEDNSSKNPSVGEVVGDILWIRPLGVIGTLMGATAYVISLPVTAPFKKTDEAKEFLITEPYNYTFKRPIGEM